MKLYFLFVFVINFGVIFGVFCVCKIVIVGFLFVIYVNRNVIKFIIIINGNMSVICFKINLNI